MGDTSELDSPIQLCVVGDKLCRDENFITACQSFGKPVIFSRDGSNVVDTDNVTTVFVVENFTDETFQRLQNEKRRILGAPAVRDLAQSGLPIKVKSKPVYSIGLQDCCILLSGYRRKSDLDRLLKRILSMGGRVVKDVGPKVTHLVSLSSIGSKYNYATVFSIPVLTEDWLHAAWDNRDNIGYRANRKEIYDSYRLPLFAGNVVSFYGFDCNELEHMTEILKANGGRVSSEGPGHASTTHLVVDENNVELLPPDLEIHQDCQIVRGEWFWNSIQIQAAADVNNFIWRNQGLLSPTPNKSVFSPTTPSGSFNQSHHSRKRKRVRRAEVINLLAAESDGPAHKRRSSTCEQALLSLSGSFLDNTEKHLLSPEAEATPGSQGYHDMKADSDSESGSCRPFNMKTATPRQQVFHELVTTETNYVGLLDCVVKIAQEAEDPDQQGGALLDQQEMKIIFGNLPPIQKVHTDMLEELKEAEEKWTEDVCAGRIILKYAADLLKAYPPFVNFFERTKNQVVECDRKNPRFHAFLKKCERRPECSRQSLIELMIRPVQRLPSISLLLTDLLKHTRRASETHPDVMLLESALTKVKEVLNHLNEEKRRTEGQIHIFDIYSEIENCPASVVSSHRSFVTRTDTIEVAAEDILCGKGYELTLFLFTDLLLIAKRKGGKMGSMIRSPSTASVATTGTMQNKALKFVTLIHLSAIKRLVDVVDSGEIESNVVAIVCRQTEDLRERCYTFQLMAEGREEKLAFLRSVSRHVANTLCRPDSESLLVKLGASEMSLDSSDLSVSSFSRALSSFYKTKQKVGRAFSFNKTPSKLKRAVSSMISPSPMANTSIRSEFGSSTIHRSQGTPSESMGDLELELGPDDDEEVLPGTLVFHGYNSMSLTPYSSRGRAESTPLSRASRLQSCSNLGGTPSSARQFSRDVKRFQIPESPAGGQENKDPEFRTPNLSSGPSFRDKFRPRSGTFAAFKRNPAN